MLSLENNGLHITKKTNGLWKNASATFFGQNIHIYETRSRIIKSVMCYIQFSRFSGQAPWSGAFSFLRTGKGSRRTSVWCFLQGLYDSYSLIYKEAKRLRSSPAAGPSWCNPGESLESAVGHTSPCAPSHINHSISSHWTEPHLHWWWWWPQKYTRLSTHCALNRGSGAVYRWITWPSPFENSTNITIAYYYIYIYIYIYILYEPFITLTVYSSFV